MAERPEDVSMVSQTSEPAVSDSDGKLYKYLLLIKNHPNINILNLRVGVISVKDEAFPRKCSWAFELNHLLFKDPTNIFFCHGQLTLQNNS